ncbi:hypothetical protein BVH06_15250 [Pseudomonas sp. PA27(2017)]|nr:hypothetical protein BVH06_15250 [Pseudomonas sp. PA27(2017)]
MLGREALALPKRSGGILCHVGAAPLALDDDRHTLRANAGTRRVTQYGDDLVDRGGSGQALTGIEHMSEAVISHQIHRNGKQMDLPTATERGP